MIPGDPEPGWNTRTHASGALAAGIALLLVALGGQCRGSLAQQRTLEPLKVDVSKITCPDGAEPQEVALGVSRLVTCGDDGPKMLVTPAPGTKVRTTPMTAAEWTQTYDACVKNLGTPYILAGRHPGISAGVGCLIEP